jgi:hypothetical protein
MGWKEDAKSQAETAKDRKSKRATSRQEERERLIKAVDTAIGMGMARAIETLNDFKELFGKRFVATRSFKGEPNVQKEYGIKDKDDMALRIDVIKVARDRIEIRVDDKKVECDVIYNYDVSRLTLDPWPTRYPNDGRALHPRHAEELGAGRGFEMGHYLGAIAVEWSKKHDYERRD